MSWRTASLIVVTAVCAGCMPGTSRGPPSGPDPAGQHAAVITVGSFDFPESTVLADIYGDALKAKGFPVRILPNLGSRELVDPALMRGLIQVVPEYAGSALQFISLGRLSATADVMATNKALAELTAGQGVVAGLPAAAQNANAIVVRPATASRYHLRSIADLAGVAPRLVFGGPPECPGRAYCLPGLRQRYGLHFKSFIPLDAGGPLTLQALEAGDIDVALLFSTDPSISARHLVVLADDRRLQPAENITPLVSRDVVARYGAGLMAVLNTVSARLDSASLRALDAQVENTGKTPHQVAEQLAARTGVARQGACGPLTDETEVAISRDGPDGLLPGSAVHRARRQRRPTGAPPPLPHPFAVSTAAWLLLAAVVLAGAILITQHSPSLRLDDRFSTWVLRGLAGMRTPWLTDVANGIKVAGSSWGVTVLGLSAVALTMAFRRWRHLLVFLCSLFFLEIVGQWIYFGLSRPRPYGVPIIASWGGYSAPSAPVAVLTIFLMGIAYCLIVAGRPRTYAKLGFTVLIALFCLSRLYLGVEHPGDALFGVALGVAIPVTAFRFFTPNEVFPVVYRRGRTAHVDVTGRRGEAIRQAMRDQLGLTVLEIKPVGLESSAGSTPLRIQVEGDPAQYVFAKLYTKGHVRADRWYKLWRTVLYGSLEDESPFKTVRRLVTYEDYALRLLQDIGVRTARPYGIVEITPEREYILVTEFFHGAVEIGEAQVDDELIDQGLTLIRKMWDAGVAHRDIKPGNLMVRPGELLLIDVAFFQVRPSPWRQAVDLGNMMLVLAVRSDPQRVYQRALRQFTPAELSEAFAATRGVASPTQLRAFMKRDPRDVLGEFRKLAPERRPIVLQRWSARRVFLAAGLLVVTTVAVVVGGKAFFPAENIGAHPPDCGTGPSMILAAQAVPSAAVLPCLAALPSGWQLGGVDIASGKASFWLDSDRAGERSATITLAAACDTAGARQIPSDQPGTRRFERPLNLVPQFSDLRFYTFPGGCVTYEFRFAPGASPVLAGTASSAVDFVPRSRLVGYVRQTEGLALCGRGAACPG